MKRKNRFLAALLLSTVIYISGCGMTTTGNSTTQISSSDTTSSQDTSSTTTEISVSSETNTYMTDNDVSASSSTLLDTENMFTERDLEQEADLQSATSISLESEKDVTIDSEGVYVITGQVTDSTIIVDADSAKVQLVLDNVSITNEDAPAIYVKNADKVIITTTSTENTLTVTGSYSSDGNTNTDAVIFSKDDLVFNGVGTLTIFSTENGIAGKDDIKFTGGTYNITSVADAIEAKDSIRISDGSFTIRSEKDGLHSENSDDLSSGYVYISGGTFDIEVSADGIQATSVLMINGGTFNINAREGLEATYVQINDGNLTISASDDGINASSKSTNYDVVIEINGGNLNITMASGDTDALDANGSLYINGGTVDITAQFAFDFDNEAKLTGGTVTVNGEEVTEITNSMMMGGQRPFGGGNGQGFNGENPPQMPEGTDRPELPEGFDESTLPQKPEGFDGANPPQKPEGFDNSKNTRNGES
ncbi:carbohydrate-binding domain-containing protein [Butyrivibrio sp. YAB3001]|uniref:carbohydrate-binding domain-containing protein n=1 Tax=Butyrivibrio sp. YAB3001 TaxID=1520812 RepID=UPI0008F63B3A|nr:carbohydrate-binding domain-containing protein [Butyrivibrio sp. YAB3001]SFB70560.1 protein of unknown function [Butyrivibrio sp. YAB3001]